MRRNAKKYDFYYKKPPKAINASEVFIMRKTAYLRAFSYYLDASSTATATATVAPTIGLLPMPVAQEITSKQWLFPLLNTRFMCAYLFRSHLRGRNVDENLSTFIIPYFVHNVKHSISPTPLYHKTVGICFAFYRCARFRGWGTIKPQSASIFTDRSLGGVFRYCP